MIDSADADRLGASSGAAVLSEEDMLRLLAGPGRVGRLTAVWRLSGRLTTRSDTHLGATDDEQIATGLDRPLHRDADGDSVVLAGSTLAGLMRHHLDKRRQGYTTDPARTEHPDVSLVFGGVAAHDTASLIVVEDSPMTGNVALRTSVSLDPQAGTAARGKLFDTEVLTAGATAPVLCDVLIPAEADEGAVLGAAVAALSGLGDGSIRLGARTHVGYGVVVTDGWTAKRLDPATPDGWRTWRTVTWQERCESAARVATGAGYPDVIKAVTAEHPAADRWVALALAVDRRRSATFYVTLTLPAERTLLIRDAPDLGQPDPPDQAHRFGTTGAVVQGPSLYGSMRSAARRVCSCAVGTVISPRLVADLWGDEPDGPEAPRPARVRITEPELVGATPARMTRIRIDPLIGDTIEGALFIDEVACSGHGAFTVEVTEPTRADITQVAHVLRDLNDGLVAIGGSAGVGHGDLSGTLAGTIMMPADLVEATAPPDDLRTFSASNTLGEWTAELHTLGITVSERGTR